MQFYPTFSSTSSSLSRAEGLGWEESHHGNHVGLPRGAFLAWPEVHSRLEPPVLASDTGLPSESPTCPSRILVMMLLLRVAENPTLREGEAFLHYLLEFAQILVH